MFGGHVEGVAEGEAAHVAFFSSGSDLRAICREGYLHDELGLAEERAVVHGLVLIAIAV